jgi:hypothetical protein
LSQQFLAVLLPALIDRRPGAEQEVLAVAAHVPGAPFGFLEC